MITCGEVDSKGHLELREDPEAWIKNNPPSRLALRCYEKEEVGESIGELTQLIRLEFLYCDSLKCVSNTITRLHKLEHLQFYKCYCLEELPANIGQLVSLTHLKLDYCENIKFLPDSIVNLSNLTYLTLSSCDSLVELPANIGQLVSLTHLKLKYCKNIKSLPLSIANLSNLTSLSLFSCESLVELPANLDGLAHLCLLDIQSSKIKCLPWSITKLRKLRHLMLPEHFRLETLPYDLNHSVIISVKDRHVRKSWEELKTEIGELPIPFGGEIRNDAAQNPSIISPPGYLRLKEDDPSQWIINNRNLLMLVRFLDLENVKELTDSIMQFSELTTSISTSLIIFASRITTLSHSQGLHISLSTLLMLKLMSPLFTA
ncbi:disease resistance protein TAO1-like [Chenopodium quinoa]|uniref:disease resistance protein TAO1-like n=1 Tax=Chenopodium quinoa TaxID=63459 RepID=UPI000B78151F|nr:disease resistance protein TAO1-like [Chenopodium quinoa]XP_021729395.1 disease resistance protein TAO1-like [Chenopodium quinoa]XP_021729400.1 disease resistance protein TAO1-like [Chenopodium quinoa]